MSDERHFKAREKKQPEPVTETPAVVEAPRKVDVTCTATGNGSYYAAPQTPAGVEFLSQFYYQPANYADHYKNLALPLEIAFSAQAQFCATVAATPSVNVVVNQ